MISLTDENSLNLSTSLDDVVTVLNQLTLGADDYNLQVRANKAGNIQQLNANNLYNEIDTITDSFFFQNTANNQQNVNLKKEPIRVGMTYSETNTDKDRDELLQGQVNISPSSINIDQESLKETEIIEDSIGNSYRSNDQWVQLQISSLDVTSEGKIFTNSIWDEAGREAGIYQDGRVIGLAEATHGWGRNGGLAVTISENYLYLGMKQTYIKNHQQEDYPAEGETWYVVRRYDHQGKPAPFLGGRGYDESMLIINYEAQVTGLAIYEDKLYVSDPSRDLIHIYQETPQNMIKLDSFSSDNPGPITADLEGNLWIVNQNSGEITRYYPEGKNLGPMITDVVNPTAITVDNQGRLLVAENGPRQQILIYEVSDRPEVVATLGVEGGIYADTPGIIGEDRLYGLSGVGTDAAGNIFVSIEGFNRSGTVLRQYQPSGDLTWELLGLEFLDTADADPYSDGKDVYTKDSRYKINYNDDGQEWSYQAYTIDPFSYPDDPRLHTSVTSTMIRRIEGKKIMFLTDMYAKNFLIYRFEGEIAVPAGIIAKKPTNWPLNQPEQGMWLWLDNNGDGKMQEEEYQILQEQNQDIWGWEVDNQGNIWVASRKQGIWEYSFQGFNDHGVPIYGTTHVEHTPMPAPLESIERLEYVRETDTMYLGGYTQDLPKTPEEWGTVGTEIIAYNNWQKGEKELAWRIQIPHDLDKDHNHIDIIKAMDVEGDRLFTVNSRTAEVYVYDLHTGKYLSKITPTVNSGWVDIPYGIRVEQRDNGEYIIFVEENAYAKIMMYRSNF